MKLKQLKQDIRNQISCFLKETEDYDCFSQIEPKMKEAQEKIGYTFNDISFLKLAFCRTKILPDNAVKNNDTYKNDTLAQIGDAVLDLIFVEYGFSDGKTKKEIDDLRQKEGKNEKLSVITEKKFKQYCYHQTHFYKNAPREKQVACSKHDSVVEAIIGAIYLDGGLNKARKWIYTNLLEEQK